MRTHRAIEERSLAMARVIVERIDADADRAGLDQARAVCERWAERGLTPAVAEWLAILEKPWKEVRRILLDTSEEGRRLRQSSPFCGIMTPQERWKIYREFEDREA
jgi:hypothetical protein